MEELEKKYVDLLFTYAGFFEEVFDKDNDIIDRDNYDDYRNVIAELRILGKAKGYNSTLVQMEEIENELPWPGF